MPQTISLGHSEISDKVAEEMRQMILAVAAPVSWSDNRKSILARAAHRLGMKPRRIKALAYGEARAWHDEYLHIRGKVDALAQAHEKHKAMADSNRVLLERARSSRNEASRVLKSESDKQPK